MSDQNTRFLLPDNHVRGQIVQLEYSYQSVLANASYAPAVAVQLGQALAAVSALGSIIKLDGSIILQAQGDGPLHTLVAQANNAGEIRGLARGLERLDETLGAEQLLGQGRLVITIDGEGGRRYQGIVQLDNDQLAVALTNYFDQSEQLRTFIHLAADRQQAACFLLQQLPGSPREEEQDHWQHALVLAQTLSDQELLTLPAEQILHRLFHEQDVQLFEPTPVSFRCRCSPEKIVPAILQMGYEEAMQLVEEEGEIRADCEFCNRSHRFDRVDVASLFKARQQAPSQTQ